MNQAWEIGENLTLHTILARLAQIWAQIFFRGFYLY